MPRSRELEAPQFALEVDLYPVLARSLPKLLVRSRKGDLVRSAAQKPVGAIIPDFIVLHAPSEAVHRVAGDLTFFEANVVAALLSGGPAKQAAIARQLYSRTDVVEQSLAVLCRRGVVVQQRSGAFAVSPGTPFRSMNVVAVEAKLRRWREALDQAISYQQFANAAYVALPSDGVRDGDSALIKSARQHGVGILSVAKERVKRVLVARHRPVKTPDFVWIASRLTSTCPATAPAAL
jgi:hypothetical protein